MFTSAFNSFRLSSKVNVQLTINDFLVNESEFMNDEEMNRSLSDATLSETTRFSNRARINLHSQVSALYSNRYSSLKFYSE